MTGDVWAMLHAAALGAGVRMDLQQWLLLVACLLAVATGAWLVWSERR